MSIKAMVTVWENSKQRGNGLLLMLAIADYMNDFGEAWPSIDTLARKTRCNRTTVIDMTKRCQVEGELEVAEGEGRNGTNRYGLGPHYRLGGSEIPTAIYGVRGGNRGVGIPPLESDTILQEPVLSKDSLEDKVPNESGRISQVGSHPAAPQNLWVSVLGQLQAVFPKAEYKTWLEPTQVVSQVDGEIVVGTANQYAASWLESHAKSLAENEIVGLAGRPMSVRFVVLERSGPCTA